MTKHEKKMIILAVPSQKAIIIDKDKSQQFIEDLMKRVMDKAHIDECWELARVMWERGKNKHQQ